MDLPGLPVSRFLWSFARDRRPAEEREVLLPGREGPRAVSVYLPPGGRRPSSAWVLLHGVTVPGRHHVALRRMGHALAAAGCVALAPDVPGWRRLEVRPDETLAAVEDVLPSLARWRVDPARVGVMGFSVSATWALEAAAGDLRGRVAAVAGMGGYGDFHRLIRAMVIGEHEWAGVERRYPPDPYGRWIMGASLLPLIEGDEWGAQADREAAAGALRQLALTAGSKGLYSGLPVYDSLIRDLRAGLPPGACRAWDALTPLAEGEPDAEEGRRLAQVMADAGIRAAPALDPRGRLAALDVPAVLLHGRGDRLVPWSETLRLAEELPARSRRAVTITRLLGHTKRSEAGRIRNPVLAAREGARFVAFVAAMLALPSSPSSRG